MTAVPETLPQHRAHRDLMRIVIVGHVDHGKSSLIGRLFHDTDSLPEGKLEAIKAMCDRRGMPFEWAFLMDALKTERDQGITIESSQIWFKSLKRDYTIIDAPGHREFLRNMLTGAANAEAALLLIDAKEGVRQQSRLHGYLLNLLGIRQIAVLVNKIDLVDYDQGRFEEIEREYRDYLHGIGVTPDIFIPISAREGDNIVAASENTKWYRGPTVLEMLDRFQPSPRPTDMPLRMPVQDIYKFDDRRIIVGRIESGRLAVGDTVLFSPSNKTGKVKTIETWNVPERKIQAQAGESVGFTLEEQIFVERGEIVSGPHDAPVLSNVMRARLFWLDQTPLRPDEPVEIRLATAAVPGTVQEITALVDADTLDAKDARADTGAAIERHAVADVVLRTKRLIALDEHHRLPRTGRVVLARDGQIRGCGVLDMEGYPDQRGLATVRATNIHAVDHALGATERADRNGHGGGVLWFTGLSGAGKSTLAMALEKELFRRGYQVFVLDGDNVRKGLNANLGFSPEDRAENIRRVGEVAALFAESGMIVVTAFISPYRADRDRARAAAGGSFREVFIEADLETCEQRDVKGLYKKARAGEIPEFTGISAPYEPPAKAELSLDTATQSVEDCLETLVAYVEQHFGRPR